MNSGFYPMTSFQNKGSQTGLHAGTTLMTLKIINNAYGCSGSHQETLMNWEQGFPERPHFHHVISLGTGRGSSWGLGWSSEPGL